MENKHIWVFALLVMLPTVVFVSCDPAFSTAKTITAFSIVSPPATGIINESAKTISVTVPYGTSVTALIASFTTTGVSVTVNGVPQISGVTANDFTNPVAYVVTAESSSETTYTVTVTIAAPSSEKAITAFSFTWPMVAGTIDQNAKTISINIPGGKGESEDCAAPLTITPGTWCVTLTSTQNTCDRPLDPTPYEVTFTQDGNRLTSTVVLTGATYAGTICGNKATMTGTNSTTYSTFSVASSATGTTDWHSATCSGTDTSTADAGPCP